MRARKRNRGLLLSSARIAVGGLRTYRGKKVIAYEWRTVADFMIMVEGCGRTARLVNLWHVDILKRHINGTLKEWHQTPYYYINHLWRDMGINRDIRTDEWIEYKINNLIKLYHKIKDWGYIYGKGGNWIAECDGLLVDGGHRVACLYMLGYDKVKTLILK